MQYTSVRKLIPIFLFLLVLGSALSAQTKVESLYQLYENQKFEDLETKLSQVSTKQQNTLMVQFLNNIFEQNGVIAQQNYEIIFNRSDGRLKYLAAEKLSEFYFAKGYYINASKYQKYLVENEQSTISSVVTTATDETGVEKPYYIQVGAFGMRENADQLKTMLGTQTIEASVVVREIGDKKLFCVWIPGKGNYDETLEMANKIKSKFDLEYRIIKQ